MFFEITAHVIEISDFLDSLTIHQNPNLQRILNNLTS